MANEITIVSGKHPTVGTLMNGWVYFSDGGLRYLD
ncbi:MAG: hypothetical protein CM15mV33_190 [uncultured marine virus]|nr:MAG: hypothetical protein CM15mV33_190 [uncultured marine virus]